MEMKVHKRSLQALLSFSTPRTRLSIRVRLVRDFSRLTQLDRLLAG